MELEETKQKHVVMLAAPVVGIVNPMLRASLKLASMGVQVTFVNSEYNRTHMKLPWLEPTAPAISSAHSSFHRSAAADYLAEISSSPYPSNLIRFLYIPDGVAREEDRPLDMAQLVASLDACYGPAFEKLLQRLVLQEPPVTCIVCTTLIRHVQDAARKLHLPFFSFWPQSAASYASLLLLAQGKKSPKDAVLSDSVDCALLAPGLPPLKYGDLSVILQSNEPDSFVFQFLTDPFKSIAQADGVLINTFDELESETVSFLREEGHPIMAVGPLLPDFFLDAAERSPPAGVEYCSDGVSWSRQDEAEEDACGSRALSWLDEQEADSVIYVSFGSLHCMTAEEMEEIAMGLEASEQAFLWVVRPGDRDAKKQGAMAGDDQLQQLLPEGFMERATGRRRRGMVIPWAPQLRVLRHGAVGGFLTHCGWNSTLEGMTAGVPLLCWPLFSDQCLNCRLAVEKWGVGMSFGGDGDGGGAGILRGEVEEKVVAMMSGDAGKALRAKAREWRAIAINAAQGSSRTNFQCFVDSFMM